MTFTLRHSLTGLAATGLIVGGSVGFVSAAAGAQETTPNLPAAVPAGAVALHNNSAEVETDCPDDGLAYWHFVFAPNNGTASFATISLELATQPSGSEVLTFSGAAIVPNGAQTDNVFVAVPAGHSLDDIILGDSSWATYTGVAPNLFNLSHECEGDIPTTTTTEAPTTTTTEAPTTTTTEAPDHHHHRGPDHHHHRGSDDHDDRGPDHDDDRGRGARHHHHRPQLGAARRPGRGAGRG